MKRGTGDHRKITRLAKAFSADLGMSRGRARTLAVGTLELLWHLTASFAPDGAIGRGYCDEELADTLGWQDDPESAAFFVRSLVEAGWLDRYEDDRRLVVHDWDVHCEDTVHMKLCRAVALFANGICPSFKRISAPSDERAALVPRWLDRHGVNPAEWKGKMVEAKVERNGESVDGVHTDGGESANDVDKECARTPVHTAYPQSRPLPVALPCPSPRPGVEAGDVRTPCALNPSSSSEDRVYGVELDREGNTIRIDTSKSEGYHPGKLVFRMYFEHWPGDAVDFVDEVDDLEAWTVTCCYWHFMNWRPTPIERMLSRYRACLNGKKSTMVDQMAKKELTAPSVVLFDSVAEERRAAGRRLSEKDAAAWGGVLESMRVEVGEESFGLWIKPTEPRWFDGDAEALEIVVPSDLARNWLASHYMDEFGASVEECFCRPLELNFVVEVPASEEGAGL